MDTYECWPIMLGNTRRLACSEEDFREYVGDVFWAVLKFIESKTPNFGSQAVIEHTKSGKFNIFYEFKKATNLDTSAKFWFRVTEAEPELLLVGLELVHQRLDLPAACDVRNPGFFKWLSKACAVVNFMLEYLDDEMEKFYVNHSENSDCRLSGGSDLSPPGLDVLEIALDTRRQSEETSQKDRQLVQQPLHQTKR